jgi:hypothetical protein
MNSKFEYRKSGSDRNPKQKREITHPDAMHNAEVGCRLRPPAWSGFSCRFQGGAFGGNARVRPKRKLKLLGPDMEATTFK